MSRKRVANSGWYICPICLTGYSLIVRSGSRCGDLAQGQKEPCVGRVIPKEEFDRAEWRVPYNRLRDKPSRPKRSTDAVLVWRETASMTSSCPSGVCELSSRAAATPHSRRAST